MGERPLGAAGARFCPLPTAPIHVPPTRKIGAPPNRRRRSDGTMRQVAGLGLLRCRSSCFRRGGLILDGSHPPGGRGEDPPLAIFPARRIREIAPPKSTSPQVAVSHGREESLERLLCFPLSTLNAAGFEFQCSGVARLLPCYISGIGLPRRLWVMPPMSVSQKNAHEPRWRPADARFSVRRGLDGSEKECAPAVPVEIAVV